MSKWGIGFWLFITILLVLVLTHALSAAAATTAVGTKVQGATELLTGTFPTQGGPGVKGK
jgi:hypothetical protein